MSRQTFNAHAVETGKGDTADNAIGDLNVRLARPEWDGWRAVEDVSLDSNVIGFNHPGPDTRIWTASVLLSRPVDIVKERIGAD